MTYSFFRCERKEHDRAKYWDIMPRYGWFNEIFNSWSIKELAIIKSRSEGRWDDEEKDEIYIDLR